MNVSPIVVPVLVRHIYVNFRTVYRVTWLRARARYLQWSEEVRLVRLEMQWTINWFRSHEMRWRERLDELDDDESEAGLQCYCYKQMGLWDMLADDAAKTFSTIIEPPSGDPTHH